MKKLAKLTIIADADWRSEVVLIIKMLALFSSKLSEERKNSLNYGVNCFFSNSALSLATGVPFTAKTHDGTSAG